MLVLLVSHAGRAVSRDELAMAAFGRPWSPLGRAVDVHIVNIRRKIDRNLQEPSLIRTVRGVGYLLISSH